MRDLESTMPDAVEIADGGYEVKAAVDDLSATYHDYSQTHHDMLDESALRGTVDSLLEEKMSRIDRELSRLGQVINGLHVAARRPNAPDMLGSQAKGADASALEHKQAFYDGYVRRGVDADLARLEAKSLSTGVDSEGGFAVPESLDNAIEVRLRDQSPLRSLCTVVQVGTSRYRKLIAVTGADAGWVAETATRPETTAPTFSEITPTPGEIYANPAATQAMLDDAFFDVEAWLAQELSDAFAAHEGEAFITGSGANRPQGFLTAPTSEAGDDSRAFGTLQTIGTGEPGTFASSDPADVLFDLIHALRPDYRREAAFVMNTQTLAMVRKFKDADGQYLWRPGLAEGALPTLLGYPVVEADHMPDVQADSLSVAFGNFRRGYLITDRQETRVLRDPYSNKPYVHFYATRRVGGALVNSDAIKLLKMG